LESQLEVAAARSAAEAETARSAAQSQAELQRQLHQTQQKLRDTSRLLDEQLQRVAVAEMTLSDRRCSSCVDLTQRAVHAESQLAVALADTDQLSHDHARALRHAASALQQLQQQLHGACEREAALATTLRAKEEESAEMRRAVADLRQKEEQGEALRSLHAEAAEAFLQQVQALQGCGRVCLRCVRRLQADGT
jgi:chromosome segregation ATPase